MDDELERLREENERLRIELTVAESKYRGLRGAMEAEAELHPENEPLMRRLIRSALAFL